VDNLLILGADEEILNRFKATLKAEFPFKDLGHVARNLGMEVEQDREEGLVYLS